MKKIGSRIKTVRSNTKSTQKDFAEKLGITQSFLSKIESGESPPTKEVLRALTESFGITIDWLLKGKEPMLMNIKGIVREPIATYGGKAKKEASKVSEKIKSFFKVGEDVPQTVRVGFPPGDFNSTLEKVQRTGITSLEELHFIAYFMETAYRQNLGLVVIGQWVENILKAVDMLFKGVMAKKEEVEYFCKEQIPEKGETVYERIQAARKFLSSQNMVNSDYARNIAACLLVVVRDGGVSMSQEDFKNLCILLEPWCFWVVRTTHASPPPISINLQDVPLLFERAIKKERGENFLKRETLDFGFFLSLPKEEYFSGQEFSCGLSFKRQSVTVPFSAETFFHLIQCINQIKNGKELGECGKMKLFRYQKNSGASLRAYGVQIGLEENEYEDLVSVIEEALKREDIRQSLIKEHVERYGML